jgi:hypothetical protein
VSKARARRPRKALGAGRSATPGKPLTPAELAFVHEYDGNGGNGTKAYMAVHRNTTATTAATLAWRLLRKVEIRAALLELRRERWLRLQMDADEALAILALTARADIRELFTPKGGLLPPHRWPDHIAIAVKGLRPGVAGTTILLNDRLAACRAILEQSGELETPAEVLGSTIARILAGHYRAPGERAPDKGGLDGV